MEKSKIQWNGKIDPDSEGAADNNEVPESVDIVWGGTYDPCWYPDNYADCVIADMYFEDFDVNQDRSITVIDAVQFVSYGRSDIAGYLLTEDDLCTGSANHECIDVSIQAGETTYLAPKTTYTWGDVAFVLEIFDGIGGGTRRAREKRLQDLEKEKKKRLIHLICRVKVKRFMMRKKKWEIYKLNLKMPNWLLKEY